MTLACKTADILVLATQVLKHLLSGQDTLVSADERKFALTQLATAVQAAAKLADVVHVQALDTGVVTVRSKAEEQTAQVEVQKEGVSVAERGTERVKAETEKVGKEVEKSVAETGRLHAEAEKVARETERAVAETERLKAEAMVVRSEKMKIDAETEQVRWEAQTGRMKGETKPRTGGLGAEAAVVRSEETRIDADTERMKGETERTKGEEKQMNVLMEAEAEKAQMEAEAEKAGKETARVVVERIGKEVDPSVQVETAEGATPYCSLLIVGAQIRQKRESKLRAAEAGNLFGSVEHLARQIKELEDLASKERTRRRIQRQKEEEVLSQTGLNR